MSKKGIDRNKKDKMGFGQEDDVETLLRAAEDDVLLKLSINSHTTHDNDNSLDSELQRRFKALKNPVPSIHKNSTDKRVSGSAKDGDVFARFATLKGADSAIGGGTSQFVVPPMDVVDGASTSPLADDEDEVEKIMRWAIDAARLDPSDDIDDDMDSDSNISSDDGLKKT